MDASPLVSCAKPLKLPFVTAIGPFSIEAIAAPPGNSSLTVLLINNNSGRNAYQRTASTITPAPIMILRLLMVKPPLQVSVIYYSLLPVTAGDLAGRSG